MTKCKKDSRQHYYIITFFNSYIAADSAAVVPGRLELPTSTLSVWRSNQLSYRTGFKLSEITTPSFIDSLFQKQKA